MGHDSGQSGIRLAGFRWSLQHEGGSGFGRCSFVCHCKADFESTAYNGLARGAAINRQIRLRRTEIIGPGGAWQEQLAVGHCASV
jgi:hypothetical protein